MSHFTCAVFTNARSGRALRAEIGKIMEPFGPDGSGKWEWYEADSRFASVLRLKDGGSAPAAVLADVDFSFDQAGASLAAADWHEWKTAGAAPFFMEDFFERYPDAEAWAKSFGSFHVGAVVTPDGEWLDGAGAPLAWEQGGCAELVSSQDPSLYVSILNCRI